MTSGEMAYDFSLRLAAVVREAINVMQNETCDCIPESRVIHCHRCLNIRVWGKVLTAFDAWRAEYKDAPKASESVSPDTARLQQRLADELRLWRGLVVEGGVPRYTIVPGAALNELIAGTDELLRTIDAGPSGKRQEASEPLGQCCHGGLKTKAQCGTCVAWKAHPLRLSRHDVG